MANWKNTIDLTDVWESEDARLIAGTIATRLEKLSPYTDEEVEYKRLDLAEAFKDASNDEDLSFDAFNSLMAEFYDWGDNDHSCWIQPLHRHRREDRRHAGVTAEAKPVSDFSSAGAGASTFYSPDLQLAITITGQLNLRTLIAAWEQAQLNADTIQKE